MVKLRALPLVARAGRSRPVPHPRDDIELRLGVHDCSRLEWTAAVALPSALERPYEIEFVLDVPAHLYSPHNVWDQKQTFTRLQSPSETGRLQIDRDDLDELRRDTLGVAHRLKTLRDKLERACVGAAAQLSLQPEAPHKDHLVELLGQAVELVAEMRSALDRPPSAHSALHAIEAQKEWALADEFLSHRLLDLLGALEHDIESVLLGPRSSVRDAAWIDELHQVVADALAGELAHRRRRGYLTPDPSSPASLSRFVERASILKKHFQDVLFLDVDAYMVDYRLRNFTGIAAASLAAAFWLAFTLLPIGPGARAGVSVSLFAVVFALSYALKDRIKELTRLWLAGRLTRLYGQRSVTLRVPARVDPKRGVLLEARETFDCVPESVDDLLNRHVGRTRKVMSLKFRMRVDLHASSLLAEKQLRSIKHVFRYDLDPIFSRLDDAVKPVPVLDEVTRRVRLVEAPKEYRLPIRLTAREAGRPDVTTGGVLVLSKRGIERLEASGAVDDQ